MSVAATEQRIQPASPLLILLALFMPYVTIGAGLYIFHSAWAAILAYHIGMVIFLRWTKFVPPRERYHFHWAAVAFGPLGILGGVFLFLLWPYANISPALPQILLDWGLTRDAWPVFIAYSALVNPALEELYWRGWLGKDTLRPTWNDALFAGFHLVILVSFLTPGWLAFAFAALTITGWMWRQVTHRANSLIPATLFHFAADVSILLVIVSEVS